MKLRALLMIFLSTAIISCTSWKRESKIFTNEQNAGSTQSIESFEFSYEGAHPNAQQLMTDSFYWSPLEETGPFGSDEAWDASQGFRVWRFSNKSASPLSYLRDLMKEWQYAYFDWNELDTQKMKVFMASTANIDEITIRERMKQAKDAFERAPDPSMKNITDKELREIVIRTAQGMGGSFLLGQDNAIIGTGFAQFALEGRVDADLQALTITAIKRQLLPMLIDRYEDDYRPIRKEQLTKMLAVITKANA